MATKKKKTEKPRSKSKPKAKAKTQVQDWPQKRNIFFRPERMKYVRRLLKQEGCVFCRSSENAMSVDTLCVYKSEHSQIVLNKFPYNNGHLLVLPLQHGGEILELTTEQYSDLHLTLKKAIAAIQSVYQPTGYNIGMNHGATGGAGIPGHLHYHIVPRWSGDLNFFPLIAETKLVIETVESTYEKFAEYFKENKV